MKSNHKLATAVLAGVAIGVACAHALRAPIGQSSAKSRIFIVEGAAPQ
jgi:hypothetical protein